MDEEQVSPAQPDEVPANEANEEVLTNEEPAEVEETAEAPEASPETEEEAEEEESYDYSVRAPQVQAPAFDLSNIPTNDDGTLDANALAQAFNLYGQQIAQTATVQAAQMVQESEERRAEEKQWQKAFEKHPELKTDKELAKEVQALRFGLFASEIESGKPGRMLSPAQAYSRINKRFSQAKADGVRQATESVRVQESVYAEPTQSATKSDTADENRLFSQMRSPDRGKAEAAAEAFLKKRLFG